MTELIRFDQIQRKLYECDSSVEMYRDPQFCGELHARLDRFVTIDTVVSLDVFDTILLRDNSSELGRFMRIGSEMAGLVDEASAVDGFLARDAGTKTTYRAREPKKGAREGSLLEVHNLSSRILSGDGGLAEEFIRIELDFEVGTLTPNRALLDYVEMHVQRGGQAILLSDMYMHQEHIRYLLKNLDVDGDLFRLVISSADTIYSKASGLIFSHIEGLLDTGKDSFFHAGDRLVGDFQKPLSAGWRALHLPISRNDVIQRQKDHDTAWNKLKSEYGISSDIAYPD